ncbi:tRNA pseudouridine(38-40) synthase TruA [candidate division WOR-1 bacterium RIFOXYA12_FULL_43_27]|uniref:tRNA pseudouridine synthase A n=1 Tax=candidate division WOR-1 bacterium RIFOXYC2_FULL_46_14 TaxID=1802587 RepID=A0A1F4U7I9_UNCSA|nr:MAG: tRNA pseudouridine(38-40) synthase TruA [candidate division WOR-1 bacterium RIFOXYA12_FULL_43_27]OGC20418.1 MAG: tRNA pseudouridine(38-40) synthase TruA [candidate division WOR-1 bacterium RIFOXYB2_FULL_46_45]OGC31845.1 MAG: tRNA pseudouridine(38-40) synthase TruA [candidate division WOR-1 bacterium RIFOXYA2_FULL_46_56]OGC40263.1 MAG: tRNA pseudouridine(38-40) synthase TruA [candidate division WOR-1 bacterium RIFOXYC2_FULL_46_14]
MRNLKLTLQYDGTNFCGYELQPGKRTIRGELEQALRKLFGEEIKLISSSRTDSGVHALQNVVNFKTENKSVPIPKIPKALNGLLPDDIRIIEAKKVKDSFNARYDAKKKTYEYLIYNGEILPPVLLNLAWHVKPKLDLAKMKKKAKTLVGTRDFSSFCAAGGDDTNFVRTLYKVSVKKKFVTIWEGYNLSVISYKFTGNGFLYKMVRLMVGALVEAGLNQKPRRFCAPPQGLCLLKVAY